MGNNFVTRNGFHRAAFQVVIAAAEHFACSMSFKFRENRQRDNAGNWRGSGSIV
jgi:hypothetical protein